MIRLAACQYAIELLESWDAYAAHLTDLCEGGRGRRQSAAAIA